MAIYTELCDAFEESNKRQNTYDQECRNFLVRFLDGLVGYLGIPGKYAKFMPLKETNRERTYTVHGASTLEADSYYHCGYQLEIIENERVIFPREYLMLHLLLKKLHGKYILKISPNDKKVREYCLEDDFKVAYEDIVQLILDRYKKGFDYFLEEGKNKNDLIGFRVNR